MITIPILVFWVMCKEDDDYNQEFGSGQFDDADEFLNTSRLECPGKTFELIAVVDA